jgi:flavorubredoxin
MSVVTEIGPDLYRISVYVPQFDLQFNHFLVKDDEPLRTTRDEGDGWTGAGGVAKVMDPSRIRWISFSHFESDECGGLNQWLELAPAATPVCGVLGAMINVNDFAIRPASGLADGEVLPTGKYRFRLCRTPHLPHGWDASVLFEETTKTLLCSDLFHQVGDVEPLTASDVVGIARGAQGIPGRRARRLFAMRTIPIASFGNLRVSIRNDSRSCTGRAEEMARPRSPIWPVCSKRHSAA